MHYVLQCITAKGVVVRDGAHSPKCSCLLWLWGTRQPHPLLLFCFCFVARSISNLYFPNAMSRTTGGSPESLIRMTSASLAIASWRASSYSITPISALAASCTRTLLALRAQHSTAQHVTRAVVISWWLVGLTHYHTTQRACTSSCLAHPLHRQSRGRRAGADTITQKTIHCYLFLFLIYCHLRPTHVMSELTSTRLPLTYFGVRSSTTSTSSSSPQP